MSGSLKKLLFGLSPRTASFDARGFECADPEVRGRLEHVLRVFVAGYNVALQIQDHERVSQRLERDFDRHHVGFAFEGAGMCYAVLDLLVPWTRSRLRAFTDRAGRPHDYIATVGAGFALARVPWAARVLDRYLERLEPMVAWCIFDGYGFHQGFFRRESAATRRRVLPASFPGYARQLVDSGLGRSFWWAEGASPARIRQAIDRFPESSRGDMWWGIGVAASYAGGVEERVLLELREQSRPYAADFLSGLPFAARMRQKGGNPSPWTDLACMRLLNTTAEEAADVLVGHVNEIAAELSVCDRDLRARAYGLLRQRLRRECEQRWGEQSLPVRIVNVGNVYGRQEP